jgi:hypothetical protein
MMDFYLPDGLSYTVVTRVAREPSTGVHLGIYNGHGGALIGTHEDLSVAESAKVMLSLAEQSFTTMAPTASFPLPARGRVRFYVFTFSGAYTADVDETDLEKGKSILSPLYLAGREVSRRAYQTLPKTMRN